jgi:hypothetical protein
MENIKTTTVRVASSIKNHVKRNRVAYGMTFVATAAIALQQANKNAFYAFLEEKGIDPMEFYCPEYATELQES